jgi:hypothetical protein
VRAYYSRGRDLSYTNSQRFEERSSRPLDLPVTLAIHDWEPTRTLASLMKANLGLLTIVLFALASSVQTDAKAGKSQAQRDFEEDPSRLASDTARWSFIFDHSNSGLDLLAQPTTDRLRDHAHWLLSADWGLKDDALRLLQLRNRLLAMGLLKPSDSRSTTWPSWIFEPPTSKQSPDVLEARLTWLEKQAEDLVEVGCKIGREKSADALFCSVE